MKPSHKIILGIVALIVVAAGITFFVMMKPGTEPVASVSISPEDIQESNFTGTRSVVTGDMPVAVAARSFIDETVATFKAAADEQVPEMRVQFGEDAPPSHYSIDLKASYVAGNATESIVIAEYLYTGGANGMSLYKVFTAKKGAAELLGIKDAIKPGQQDAFVAFVKQALIDWRPGDATEPVVSPEYVDELTIDLLSNWSIHDGVMTIYFDKYEVGVGALGPVALPIELSKVAEFLTFTP